MPLVTDLLLYFPALAPLGYLNKGTNKGQKKIVPDPAYFSTLQELWKLMSTGNYQLADLYRIMQEKYPIYKSGKLLAFSSFHRIFHNPFYCGLFRWNGELQLGTHKTMISQNEFEQIQNFLGKKNKTRQKKLEFDFKGVFKCGWCNACITAERKQKFIKSTDRYKTFDYYRCTHNKRNIECHQKPISKKKLESQILNEIEKIYLPKEIVEYGIQRLKIENTDEKNLQKGNTLHIEKEIKVLINHLKKVEENLAMESDVEIRQIMKRKHTELKILIKKLNENQNSLKEQSKNWKSKLIKEFQIILNAKKIILEGSISQKRQLLHDMGLNWELKDRMISYKPNFVLQVVGKARNYIMPETEGFEPSQNRFLKGQNMSMEEVASVWSALWELIRNSKDFM